MMGFIALVLSLISLVFAVVSCCVVRKMSEDAEGALLEAVEVLRGANRTRDEAEEYLRVTRVLIAEMHAIEGDGKND